MHSFAQISPERTQSKKHSETSTDSDSQLNKKVPVILLGLSHATTLLTLGSRLTSKPVRSGQRTM